MPAAGFRLYPKDCMSSINQQRAGDLTQKGMDLLAAGQASDAVHAFREAIAADATHHDAHHGLVRALRDAGQTEQSIAAALALTALTPNDPWAHAALSISLQHAGHVPEAEAAAGRARILEWKIQLQSPADEESAL
jgi:Flp pilus assembly protein TadD